MWVFSFSFESRILGTPPTTGGYSEPWSMGGDPYQKIKHPAGPDWIPERYRESAKENMGNIAPSAGFSPAWSPVYRGPPRGGCKRGRINKILQKSIVSIFMPMPRSWHTQPWGGPDQQKPGNMNLFLNTDASEPATATMGESSTGGWESISRDQNVNQTR